MFNKKSIWAGLIAAVMTAPAVAGSYIPSNDSGVIKDPAAGWDSLWHTVLVDISIMGILFAVILAFLIWKYRRRPGTEGGGAPALSTGAALAWSLIPAFIFLADDLYLAAKGWQLWNIQRTVPANRLEIALESGMYSWNYTYPNGVQTHNELKVPAGTPVLLRMTSRDTIHNHYIPDFRIKEDSMPGRITYLWFYPQKPGQHLVTCNEYCGVMHAYMSGQITVLPANEYHAWYEQEGSKVKLANAGSKQALEAKKVVAVAEQKQPS